MMPSASPLRAITPDDYAKAAIQMKSFTILFSFANARPAPANSISQPKLTRASANFLNVPAENKLCSEGRRRADTRNKTDERDSRPSEHARGRRLYPARSSPWLSPPRPAAPSARPFHLKTAQRAKPPLYCHLHLPKICLPLKLYHSQSLPHFQ